MERSDFLIKKVDLKKMKTTTKAKLQIRQLGK